MKQIDRHQVREHTEYGIPVLNEDYDELPDCNCSDLEQRVGELEDWKKITDTAGKKLAEDNIRLRKALEDIVKTGNNKNLTDQQQRLQMYELARAEVYISLPTEAEEEVWEMPLSYAHQSHVKV